MEEEHLVAGAKSQQPRSVAASPDPLTHPYKPLMLGLCEALGPDASLRRVIFLMELWQAGRQGMTATELEQKVESVIGVAQSTTSRTVRLLTESGLVESFLCPGGRRSRLIRLTGIGRVILRGLGHTALGDVGGTTQTATPPGSRKSSTGIMRRKRR